MAIKELDKNLWDLVDITRSKEELLRILMALFSNYQNLDHYGLKNYYTLDEVAELKGNKWEMTKLIPEFKIYLAIKYILADISIDNQTSQDSLKRTLILFRTIQDNVQGIIQHWSDQLKDLNVLYQDFKNDPKKYFSGFRRVTFDYEMEDFNDLNDPMFVSDNLEEFEKINLKDISDRISDSENHIMLCKRFTKEFDSAIQYLESLLKQYVDAGLGSRFEHRLKWLSTDTDLLEVIMALLEKKTIQNNTNSLTKKEAIETIAEFFQQPISHSESKISKMIDRKKGIHPFLDSLVQSLDDYTERQSK